MSYARVGSTGHYIYLDNDGFFNFDHVEVNEDVIDVFLHRLSEYRPDELQRRIEHGKELCDEWVKNTAKLELDIKFEEGDK